MDLRELGDEEVHVYAYKRNLYVFPPGRINHWDEGNEGECGGVQLHAAFGSSGSKYAESQ